MKLAYLAMLAAAVGLPFLSVGCKNRAGAGAGGYGQGGWGGSTPNQDQLDFYGLPQRNEGISLYGPGSENVQRDPVEPVYFGFDSSSISPSEMPKVQQLSAIARGTLVIIAGHTDATGTLEYNRALGERRAMAVRQELLRMGVPGSNIQTISYGEDMLSGQGDSYDRRAEFGALIQRGGGGSPANVPTPNYQAPAAAAPSYAPPGGW